MSEAAQPIRSPAYPSMSLADALEAVRKIEHNYRTSRVDRVSAAKLIGYSSLSGPANKALAALAQYGLVERAGKGEMRVSPRATAILHPDSPAERAESLKLAAFEPSLFKDLRDRYPDMVPPEDGVVTYLNRKGFNQTAIRPAVKAYLQTLQFLQSEGANLSQPPKSQNISTETSDSDTLAAESSFGSPQVGDLIQWEMDGVLRLEHPMRVRLITADGKWVAVEGSETGIPTEQVCVIERPSNATIESPRFPLAPNNQDADFGATKVPDGWKEERLIDDGGEEIFIRYRGEPTQGRYTFIRDYLDFKLDRMKKAGSGA